MQDSINEYVFCGDVFVRVILVADGNDDAISEHVYYEVKSLAQNIYGARDWTIEKDNMGKPYYIKSDGYFLSVSHTDKMVAVAVCKGTSIGVDIERIHKISDKVISKYYTESEKLQIAQETMDNQIEEVKIWTLKEAHCKCTGTGLNKHSLRWDSVNEKAMLLESKKVGDYVVSVCRG